MCPRIRYGGIRDNRRSAGDLFITVEDIACRGSKVGVEGMVEGLKMRRLALIYYFTEQKEIVLPTIGWSFELVRDNGVVLMTKLRSRRIHTATFWPRELQYVHALILISKRLHAASLSNLILTHGPKRVR
jgi:hypothetical protein